MCCLVIIIFIVCLYIIKNFSSCIPCGAYKVQLCKVGGSFKISYNWMYIMYTRIYEFLWFLEIYMYILNLFKYDISKYLKLIKLKILAIIVSLKLYNINKK